MIPPERGDALEIRDLQALFQLAHFWNSKGNTEGNRKRGQNTEGELEAGTEYGGQVGSGDRIRRASRKRGQNTECGKEAGTEYGGREGSGDRIRRANKKAKDESGGRGESRKAATESRGKAEGECHRLLGHSAASRGLPRSRLEMRNRRMDQDGAPGPTRLLSSSADATAAPAGHRPYPGPGREKGFRRTEDSMPLAPRIGRNLQGAPRPKPRGRPPGLHRGGSGNSKAATM
jgi:hypothetical protein